MRRSVRSLRQALAEARLAPHPETVRALLVKLEQALTDYRTAKIAKRRQRK